MGLTLFCRHSSQIAHLEAEIDWLRAQLVHERQRAERGVDRLLATRGIGPITVPEARPTVETEDAIREMLSNGDFQRIGEAA